MSFVFHRAFYRNISSPFVHPRRSPLIYPRSHNASFSPVYFRLPCSPSIPLCRRHPRSLSTVLTLSIDMSICPKFVLSLHHHSPNSSSLSPIQPSQSTCLSPTRISSVHPRISSVRPRITHPLRIALSQNVPPSFSSRTSIFLSPFHPFGRNVSLSPRTCLFLPNMLVLQFIHLIDVA